MTYPLWRWLAFVAVAGVIAGVLTGASPGSLPASITVTSSPNPAVFGAPVTLTATVSPADGAGKVTFYDGTTVLGISTLASGQAALTTSLLASGPRSIQAYYSGDMRYAASLSARLAQTVNAVPGDGFVSAVDYPAGSYPFSVAVGDFNGDGRADLAVANPSDPSGVSVLLGNGDGTFEAPVNYATGQGPTFVAVGDFNGDGKDDLVLANRTSNSVSVLLGNGDGTFQPAVNYPAGSQPWSIAVADFNSDGRPDMVVSNFGSGNVSVFLGNGDGVFQPAVNYETGGQAWSVAVGDFNGDGRADLAVTDAGFANTVGFVQVLLGNGDGTFRAPVGYAVGMGPIVVVVADFNVDGKNDLVVANQLSDNMSVLLGHGDGTFKAAMSYAPGNGYAYSMAVGDFNGDGKADLAFASGSSLNLALGNGDGTFQPVVKYPVGGSLWSVAVGDFNGDGRTDLALANSTGDSQDYVSVVLATKGLAATATLTSSLNPSIYGQGVTLTANISPPAASGSVTFLDGTTALGTAEVSSSRAVLNISSLVSGAHSLTAVYSGDVSYGVATSPVLKQAVNLATETTTLTSSENPSTYGQNVTLTAALAPIDGAPSGSGTVAFKDGTASLGARAVIGGQASLSTAALPPGPHSLTAIYSGDANHAASASFVLTQVIQGTATTPATVLTSSANPATFGQSVTLTATISPAASGSGSVTFYDGVTVLGTRALLNGRATLTTSLLASGTRLLRAYYGGNTSYTPSTSASMMQTVSALPANGFQQIANPGPGSGTVAAPLSMAVGDFNEDGTGDIAVADSNTGNVSVLLGNGDGTFQSAVNLPLGGSPNSVAVGDFNGDGHTDLTVSNGDSVSVLLGNGDGTFQAAVPYTAGVGPQGLAVGDFNGDGKADIAVVNTSGVSILLGNGDGTFQAAVNVSGAGGNAIAAGDFNGDGTADLGVMSPGCYLNMLALCSGFTPGDVSVLLGNGDGTFRAPVIYPNASGDSVVIGDFNGDGKADLAIGVAGVSAKLIFYGDVEVLLGKGDGTFQPAVNYPLPGSGAHSIVAGDFNGDGKTDLAVVSAGVTVLLGKGDGTFPTMVEYPSSSSVIAVGSFNGDGRTDLAAATGNGVNVLLGTTTSVPSINAGGVVNAASLKAGPLAPGSIAAAFGSFPVNSSSAVSGAPLPNSLAGLSIQFGDRLPAPLFAVSGSQVNFQVPWDVFAVSAFTISATLNGQPSFDQTINIASFAPGIFSANSQGTGQGAILDSAYRLAGPTNPATAGSSIVQIYCTGLGPVINQPLDGSAAVSNPLSTTQYPPLVTIGGAPATVLFSGLTPGGVGLYQVNARVPEGSSKGAAVPVVISIEGVVSNTVTMAVQ